MKHREWIGWIAPSVFYANAFPVDRVVADPAVDVAAIVGDLETLALDRTYEMKIVMSVDLAEHDVAGFERVGIDGDDGAELTGFDPTRHGAPVWAKPNSFACTQLNDVEVGPTHGMFN